LTGKQEEKSSSSLDDAAPEKKEKENMIGNERVKKNEEG
jgi:hypothetical protein